MNEWMIYALVSAFFAALTAIFGKLGIEHINSDMATLLRTAIILVILLSIVLARNEWQNLTEIHLGTWVFLTLSGAATGLSWIYYYKALQLGQASKVAPIDKFSIVFTILLSAILLGEKLTVSKVIGSLIMTAGAIIILF